MPNNQSLDRVKKSKGVNKFMAKYRYQYHKEMKQELAELINSELQNLRQELAREVEGLKLSNPVDKDGKIWTSGHNEAIDKVLAIIRSKDVQE